jgi:hypothetical protein
MSEPEECNPSLPKLDAEHRDRTELQVLVGCVGDRSSHNRVEPSMSVKRNVTVPVGNSATQAPPHLNIYKVCAKSMARYQ